MTGCLNSTTTVHSQCQKNTTGSRADRAAQIGYCLLELGFHDDALAAFEAGIAASNAHAQSNFGAGWVSFFKVLDDLYTNLLDLSFRQTESFDLFRSWLDAHFLGNEAAPGALQIAASRFRTAQADPDFRINMEGTIVRLNTLEVYLDFWEADTGDAWFFAGLVELLRVLFEIIVAHDLDIPISDVLESGEPIYTLIKLDLDAVFADPDKAHFLKFADGSDAHMEKAKHVLISAIDDLVGTVPAVMAEIDNQSTPDNAEDYPDILSRSFLDWKGDIFIPGIFGPSPLTAILQALFRARRDGAIAQIIEVFPNAPAELPDAFVFILNDLRHALANGKTFEIAGLNLPVTLFFDAPIDLRSLYELTVASDDSEGNIFVEGLEDLENRTDGERLPWQHPELYEPVPTFDELEADPIRGFDGPSAELHVGNGELHAGLTREGRLKNLFYPGLTSFNLVPYITRVRPPYLETEPIPYMGANVEHGSFAGLRIDGELTWLMDWLDYRHYNPLDTSGRGVLPYYLHDDAPIGAIDYQSTQSVLKVSEVTFVPRFGERAEERKNVVVRSFTVTNTGTAAVTASFVYYGAFDITTADQWMVSPKFWVAWQRAFNDIQIETGGDVSWVGPGWDEHPKGDTAAILLDGDGPSAPLRRSIGRLTESGERGAFSDATSRQTSSTPVFTDFGNAYIEWDLGTLTPGHSAIVTVYIAAGSGHSAAAAKADAREQISFVRSSGVAAAQGQTRMYWQEWVASCKTPDGLMSASEAAMYRKAAMALKMDQAALTGAMPELWDMQPMWFMIWPGNAVWHAGALLAMGHAAEAEAYLDFAAGIQARDGHWRMAYTALGDHHGAFEVENYQTGTLVWFAWTYWKMTGNTAWLTDYWPTTERGADFLVSRLAMNNLTYGTPDFVEDINAFRQSLFTNTIVVAALVSAGELADALGKKEKAAAYRAHARTVYDAVVNTYWIESEGVFYEQFDMNGPHGKGGLPTMSWPFHAFALDDPRITSFAQKFLHGLMLEQDWLSFEESHDWTPGLMENAAFLMNHHNIAGDKQSLNVANQVIDGVLQPHNLTLGGFLAERFMGYGVKGSGKPLIWPHSSYIFTQLSRLGESPLPLTPLIDEVVPAGE